MVYYQTKEIARAIKKRRLEIGGDQEEIAKKLNLSLQRYESLEKGEAEINSANIFVIAHALNLTVCELLERQEKKERIAIEIGTFLLFTEGSDYLITDKYPSPAGWMYEAEMLIIDNQDICKVFYKTKDESKKIFTYTELVESVRKEDLTIFNT